MPRISVNKLGEYLVQTNPIRRRAIIRDQKLGNPPAQPRYRKALQPICDVLEDAAFDPEPIHSAIEALRTEESASEWVLDDNAKTADALEKFLNITGEFPIEGVTYRLGSHTAPKLTLSGVEVSVRPDIIIEGQLRGRQIVGGIKFHYTVDDKKALGLEGGRYVAALLRQWLSLHGPNDRHAHQNFCYSVDVFQEQVVAAPSSFARLYSQAEAACEEIGLRWDAIN
jgi:hypothetical protein